MQEVEDKVKSKKEAKRLSGIWKVGEAKFASTGILSKLSKVLDLVCIENIEVTLPVDLVSNLSQNYEQLSFDVVVEKREWQTDCYYDYKSSNTNPFLTKIPDLKQQEANSSAIKSVIVRDQSKSRKLFVGKGAGGGISGKKVRMSTDAKGESRIVGFKSSPERPHTARSNISNFSYKSELSEDGHDSYLTTDYDRLPAELCPTILHYRRESTSLKIKNKTPTLTRMEKILAQRKKQELEKTIKKAKREYHNSTYLCVFNQFFVTVVKGIAA